MKNIIVSTHDSIAPIKGGGALRTLKIAEELKKRGYSVNIIAPTDGIDEVSGMKVHWLHPPRKQRSQILSSIKFNIRLLRKFLQFVKHTDIFFIHNTIAAAFMPFLKAAFRFKFILDITDIHAEYLPIGKRNILEIILTPHILKYEYAIIKSADFIIVVTNAMKELLISKGIAPEKIAVIYDGTDSDRLPINKEEDAQQGVIHLGTIDRQHNVELIIQAIPSVIKNCPKAKFFFIGGGRELPNIKKAAADLNVTANCVFTDFLPCDCARAYLKNAAIGIIPRKDCLPNRIVTTLKLYEYWASGTAVIASRLKGIQEIAQDKEDVLFFDPADPEDLARKIVSLIKDKQAVAHLANNGFKTVKKFSWDILRVQLVDLIEDRLS